MTFVLLPHIGIYRGRCGRDSLVVCLFNQHHHYNCECGELDFIQLCVTKFLNIFLQISVSPPSIQMTATISLLNVWFNQCRILIRTNEALCQLRYGAPYLGSEGGRDLVGLHRQSILSLCLKSPRNITSSNSKVHNISKNPS